MTLTPSITLALLTLACVCAARFTTDLHGYMQGDNIMLTWEAADPAYYPLYIQATVFTTDSGTANMLQTNITSNLAAGSTSFKWTKVPDPLGFLATGQYQLVIQPQKWDVQTQGPVPIVARSDLFTILPSSDGGLPPETTDGPSFGPAPIETPTPSHSYGRTIAIAVCVGVGIPALIGIGVLVWCMRRRRKEKDLETRRRRFEMVIH